MNAVPFVGQTNAEKSGNGIVVTLLVEMKYRPAISIDNIERAKLTSSNPFEGAISHNEYGPHFNGPCALIVLHGEPKNPGSITVIREEVEAWAKYFGFEVLKEETKITVRAFGGILCSTCTIGEQQQVSYSLV